MRASKSERLLERCTQKSSVESSGLREERDIRQILHPGVIALAWLRVGVQFLGNVCFARVDAQQRARDSHEGEKITPVELLDLTYQHVAECSIDSKGIAIWAAREQRVDPEAATLVDDSLPGDRVAMRGTIHFEDEVVPFVTAARELEFLQQGVRASHATQVHILRGASPSKAQFENDTPFEQGAFAEHREDSHEKAFEEEALPQPIHGDALLQRGTSQAGFKCLLESIGRGVSP